MNRFDIVQGHYWWLAEHYSSQGSKEYARLCKLSYKPAMSENGPNTNDSHAVYQALCAKHGCDSGYRNCACRDCFDLTIGTCREFCDECIEAGCLEGRGECQRDDAYGMDEEQE